MLNSHKKRNSSLSTVVLLSFISCFAFHSLTFADTKLKAAEEYRDLGFTQQQKGNLPEALNNYIKAVELGLENPVVLNDIGVIYEQIGLFSKAEQFYLQAVQVDENYLPAYTNLAYLYQSNGQEELAFQYFKKRFERAEPNDPWAQKAKEELLKIRPEAVTWALTHEAKGLDKELVVKVHEEFTKSVTLANEHFRRGQKFAQEGQYTRAFLEFDEALRLTPHNPKIVQAKKDLVIQKAKEDFERRSEHALKMLESGNTLSARQEIRNMLSTIPSE
ncbi:MAG TPA: tetratricopeptide repeat protein [Candidatus Omnitrophota bacterium]|nr:tetratricopeptide repeat protein [Candidatus Omnitrophota bacterium]